MRTVQGGALRTHLMGKEKDDEFFWPIHATMKGLPFMLQGWNNTYVLSAGNSHPVYQMERYNLYGFIPIIGVSITKIGGTWHVVRDCDGIGWPTSLYKLGKDQNTPFGQWTHGAEFKEGTNGPWYNRLS